MRALGLEAKHVPSATSTGAPACFSLFSPIRGLVGPGQEILMDLGPQSGVIADETCRSRSRPTFQHHRLSARPARKHQRAAGTISRLRAGRRRAHIGPRACCRAAAVKHSLPMPSSVAHSMLVLCCLCMSQYRARYGVLPLRCYQHSHHQLLQKDPQAPSTRRGFSPFPPFDCFAVCDMVATASQTSPPPL
jgi:hypothetical protein